MGAIRATWIEKSKILALRSHQKSGSPAYSSEIDDMRAYVERQRREAQNRTRRYPLVGVR